MRAIPCRRHSFLLLCSSSYLGSVTPFCSSYHLQPKGLLRNLRKYPATALHVATSSGPVIANGKSSNDITSLIDGEIDDAMIPIDETFSRNPYKKIISPLLKMATASETKAATHDKALEASGGVWKSFFINKTVYSVSGYIPGIIRQLTKAEARGYLQNDLPEHFTNIIGKESLLAMKDIHADDSYLKAKRVLVDALSTQNVLNGKLEGINKELHRLAAHWENVANEGGTTAYYDDVSKLAFNVIINAIFGEKSISKQDIENLREWSDQFEKGIAGLPIETPILRKLPFFRRYSRAMKTRNDMRSFVKEKIAFKRAQLEKSKVDPSFKFESTGILDDFILRMDSSDALSEEQVITFCADNTILSIMAGFDTSSSLMSNIMLILHSDPEALHLVRKELSTFDITSMPKNQLEALDSLPVFKSVLLEAYRHHPAIINTYRRTTAPVVVGNVRIPANSSIRLSNIYGSYSEKLYDSPKKVCPLRFYKKKGTGAGSASGNDKMEPPPNVFGYGKHLCPGQYVAQIEIVLVSKQFLTNYDYELVEGQDLRHDLLFNYPRSGLKMKLKKRN